VLCCSVSVFRPSTGKTAQQGGQREWSSEGTASGPLRRRAVKGERLNPTQRGATRGKDLKTIQGIISPLTPRERAQLAGFVAFRMRHDRCESFRPVSKLNRAGTERSVPLSQRSGGESGVERRFRLGVRRCGPGAEVCDFASGGTVPLAHVAGAAKVAVFRPK